MVTKEAAMSFSQFGYPYNATSQVSHFVFHFYYYHYYTTVGARVHALTVQYIFRVLLPIFLRTA